jgi:hypothetical protein
MQRYNTGLTPCPLLSTCVHFREKKIQGEYFSSKKLCIFAEPACRHGGTNMCKYKDTQLGISKLDFGVKRGMMAVFLTDGREVLVPVSMFPDIKKLSKSQREEWMIMDDQYFSFEDLSKIYSVKDVLKY